MSVFFSILSDWLKKGEKASKFKDQSQVCILSLKKGELSLETCRKDVFLYHLRLLQLLDQASVQGEVKAYHLVLLRQVLENVASFLGVGQFSYVLEQIGIDDVGEVSGIINTLSHKKIFYFESDDLVPDTLRVFDRILTGLKEKYQFVLHAPALKTSSSLSPMNPEKSHVISVDSDPVTIDKKARPRAAQKTARGASKS